MSVVLNHTSPGVVCCSLSDLDPKLFAPGVTVAGKSEKELAKQEQVRCLL